MTSTELRNGLTFEVAHRDSIPANRWREIVDLCGAAFDEDFDSIFGHLPNATHVLAYLDGTLVSQACWVVRWLQPSNLGPLRTAYVEVVATPPQYRHNGYASEVMRRLAVEVGDFELAGLSTGSPSFYERLGWEQWRGPLAIRTDDDLLPTPRDSAMVLRLPMTPKLDLDLVLTAEWREGELWVASSCSQAKRATQVEPSRTRPRLLAQSRSPHLILLPEAGEEVRLPTWIPS